MGLSEIVQLAMMQSDTVRVLDGGMVSVSPLTAYDPEVRAFQRDAAFAIFDPKFTAGYLGSQINEPPSSFFGPGIPQQTRRDEGDFTAELSKLWATGGTTKVGYQPPLGYLFIPGGSNSAFNPIYSSALVMEARQPLLRGAGKSVNRAPLKIAQLRQEQSAWAFQEALLVQVRSIEEAYWDLQAAAVGLQAIESIVILAEETVRIEQARFAGELAIRADVARAWSQLAQFQQERTRAELEVVNREFRLWNLMGCAPVEGERLIPADVPRQHTPEVDPHLALEAALVHRPDMAQRRLSVSIREWEYRVAENGLQPQLDLTALYRANGVGQELNDALRQASQYGYTDWTLGVTLSIPLGNRAPRANYRTAEWQLMRERALLRADVRNLAFHFAELARTLQANWTEYEQSRQRVETTHTWLQTARIRFATPPPNAQSSEGFLLLLYDYQAALRAQVDAVVDAARLLARYNGLLARWEEAQGTLLERWDLQIESDPVEAVNRHRIPVHNEHVVLHDSITSPVPRPRSASVTNPEASPTRPGSPSQSPPFVTPAHGPADAATVDPAIDYRAPESLDRSPFRGGWSRPATPETATGRGPSTAFEAVPSQRALRGDVYHQNSVRR